MEQEQVEACVDAAAVAVGLEIAPAHRPGVVHYFGLAASLADLVMAHPFELDDEPAPVFMPIEPFPDARP